MTLEEQIEALERLQEQAGKVAASAASAQGAVAARQLRSICPKRSGQMVQEIGTRVIRGDVTATAKVGFGVGKGSRRPRPHGAAYVIRFQKPLVETAVSQSGPQRIAAAKAAMIRSINKILKGE